MLDWQGLLLQIARSWHAAKEGMGLVASSPYLCALCAFMLLQYVCSSLFYFEKSLVVAAAGQDAAHRTAFFGAINSASALCILMLQLMATGTCLDGLFTNIHALRLCTLVVLFFCSLVWGNPHTQVDMHSLLPPLMVVYRTDHCSAGSNSSTVAHPMLVGCLHGAHCDYAHTSSACSR